jgi:cytidine deaminase
MHRKALEARLEGFHYENFLVGAAAIGITAVGPVPFWGSNYKSHPGTSGPRVCAEDDMHVNAIQRGCLHIRAFAVASMPKIDDESGRMWKDCNPPCGTCRRMFAASLHNDGIFRATTECHLMRLGLLHGEVVVEKIVPITIAELLEEFPAEDP